MVILDNALYFDDWKQGKQNSHVLILVLPERWPTYIPGTLSWSAQSPSEYLPSQEVRIPGKLYRWEKGELFLLLVLSALESTRCSSCVFSILGALASLPPQSRELHGRKRALSH